jgi:hypothetical protein
MPFKPKPKKVHKVFTSEKTAKKEARRKRWTRTAVDVRTGKRTKAPMWGILDRIVTPKPDPYHNPNAPQGNEPWGH